MTASLLVIALYLVILWSLERGLRQPGRPRCINRDIVGNAARDLSPHHR
jgi:hypothetical protein